MSETLDVAVLQLTSIDDVATNLETVMELLKSLESSPPELISLPENALYFRLKEGAVIPGVELEALRLSCAHTFSTPVLLVDLFLPFLRDLPEHHPMLLLIGREILLRPMDSVTDSRTN